MELRTYVEVAQKARLLETISSEDRAERARAKESKQSPTQSRLASSKWQDGGSPTKSLKNKSQQIASQGTPSQRSNARSGGCFYCGRTGHQQKDCWKFYGWCLRCGAPGHLVNDCPKSSATAPTGPGSSSGVAVGPSQRRDTGKGIAKGRIFVLAQTEVPESTSVVGGTLYIYGYSVRVLMDSGASHSFISARFASCLDVTPDCMSYILDVSTPTWTSMYTDSVYRSCEMSMAGIPLYADFIVLPIRDFDVILGMDWLSTHRARMDYYHKTVDFCLLDGTTFQFKGDKGFSTPIISFIRASRYLEKGCEGYLAYVIDRRKEKGLSLEEIPVVCEFPDVFPDDLGSLPPKRSMEFVIDLVPGMAPICKSPYRMAPAELRELKL
ncbi:zf-CCHC domain-containing protein/RVP_2 domain-containing protein [Cephalotus follicularis]|uniref:Zf-CCHC domain-containing protein/RVP_2 domain-containing protein n=1 Tax=Cephalotus follicularis TaxID=3775 RepID=A0A1Q3C557_CEPFO|nr:zf-CCHC domain-containing protein/RVP_2 domain-containing protein [Cephalotus follicularis]